MLEIGLPDWAPSVYADGPLFLWEIEMARYANVTCSKCDKILPGNKMHRVKDRVTSTSQNSVKTKGGIWTTNSRREHHSSRERRLCGSCYLNRLIVRFGIVGGIAASIFFGSSGNQSRSDSGSRNGSSYQREQNADTAEAVSAAHQEGTPLGSGNPNAYTPAPKEAKARLLSGGLLPVWWTPR